MKKLFVSVWTIVAIASFGGSVLPVHAATLTPAEQATLQQSLDSMKAQLQQLENQASAQAQAQAQSQVASPAASGLTVTLQPAAQSATGVSSADLAAVNSALTSLAAALSSLETTINNNPQVATTNAAGISLALQGIGHTLSMIVATVAGGNAGNGNIASAAPSPSVTLTTPPATTQNSAPSVSVTSPAPVAVTAPQTSQAASFGSFQGLRWPYIVVGILVLAAVALWLWWPSEEDGKGKKKNASTPSAPIKSGTIASGTQSPSMTILASSGKPVPQSSPTPLASAVSAPTQQQQQQRKPA